MDPIKPALLLPEVTDVTKRWEGKHQYMDPEGSHIFVFVGSIDMPNLFYNKNLVDPNEFKSYWDVIKAKWRGKIVAVDPRQPGRPRVGARILYNLPDLGEKFLTRLFAEMDVALSRDDRQALDWLAVGKYALCLFCGNIEAARAQGLPVEEFETYRWKGNSGDLLRQQRFDRADESGAASQCRAGVHQLAVIAGRSSLVSKGHELGRSIGGIDARRYRQRSYSRAAATSRRNEVHHHGYAGTEQSRAGEQAFERDHQEIAANLVGKIASTRKLIDPFRHSRARGNPVLPSLPGFRVVPAFAGVARNDGMRKPSDQSVIATITNRMLDCVRALTVSSSPLAELFMPQPHGKRSGSARSKLLSKKAKVSYYTVGEFNFLSRVRKEVPRIKVKVVQGRGNELLVRIMTERRAGKYLADVARIGNTSPYALYQAKTLQPIAGAFILPEVKDESKWWSGKHQYIDAEGKYIFVPVGSVSVNMVGYNSELVAPAELELVLGSLAGAMARQDRRHRSARRRLRQERCAHGLLSSATGRRVFASAI